MRRRLLALLAAAPLAQAGPVASVTIDWVPVNDANNAADTPSTNCYASDCGSVPYNYAIAKYEITNAQYAEFLNAVAASDPLGLYDTSMDADASFGGITRSGSDGSYTYAAKAGFEDEPVTYVSFWDALRFANWLNNGQGSTDTETGAYTITADGIANNTITRNEGEATIVLPDENEWYKAAYYSPGGSYFDYPTGADAQTACVAPTSDTGNSANCSLGALTDVGAYGLSASPYGTFDQGGSVWEWNEGVVGADRGLRGGGWNADASFLAASSKLVDDPTDQKPQVGFRVAHLAPEPGQGILVVTGALVLLAMRRQLRG
jgi:formylglycine-generating enzyme required for sulfatase activity